MGLGFCRIQEEWISALWGYTGRAEPSEKTRIFFRGSWWPNSLCRATCNPTNTLFCWHWATHDHHLYLDKSFMACVANSIIKGQLWQLWLCLQSSCRQVKAEQVRGWDPRATLSKLEYPVFSQTSWRFLSSVCKAEYCQIMDAKILSCDPLKRRREREKVKNWIGHLQSWACCFCSHGRDAIWEKERLSHRRQTCPFPSLPSQLCVSSWSCTVPRAKRLFPSCGTWREFSLERSHFSWERVPP